LTCSSGIFESGHVGALFQLTHERILADAKVDDTGDNYNANIVLGGSDALNIKGNFTFNTHGTWTGTVRLLRKEGSNDWETFRTFIANGDRNIQYTGTENQYNVQYQY